MSFAHLHVASAYSTHYGVSLPEALVDQAAAQGDTFLAVTDRDGLYGAVKHVRACVAAGIRPGLGADLAVHDEEHHPLGRVVVLAHGAMAGRGFAALCRAVSAAHKVGKKPSISRARLAELAGLRSLTVLIGPASDVPKNSGSPPYSRTPSAMGLRMRRSPQISPMPHAPSPRWRTWITCRPTGRRG